MHRELSPGSRRQALVKKRISFFLSLSQDFAQKVAHRSPNSLFFFCFCVFILVFSFFFLFWGKQGTDYVIWCYPVCFVLLESMTFFLSLSLLSV